MGRILDLGAGLLCIGAGLYLLQYNATGDGVAGTSWFQIIGHGMGIYFLGKGVFVARANWIAAETRDAVASLVEWKRYEHHDAIEAENAVAAEPAPVD